MLVHKGYQGLFNDIYLNSISFFTESVHFVEARSDAVGQVFIEDAVNR